ncbi:MAG TPA: hypothetical protein VK445_07150, partial [Dissulfurispiraceae bacterium]|nr:hypothetical protein [Dissulfurispiraceae bacterium]
IDRPVVCRMDFGQADAGKCACGAVYVCDPTGRNEGEAYRDALVLAKGDWEIDQLAPGEDYDVSVMDYDMSTHIRIYSRSSAAHVGRLLFVKMRSADAAPKPVHTDEVRKKGADAMVVKKEVLRLLDEGAIEEIGRLAAADKNVLKYLIAASYDKEDVRTWRAIEAMGQAAHHAKVDVIRETTRKLLWSMTDESGGIGWSAPEMLGEIVRANPKEYGDLIPLIWSCRDEDLFRPGAIWGLYRASQTTPGAVSAVVQDIDEVIADPNPAVRGYGYLLAIQIKHRQLKELEALIAADPAEIQLFDEGDLKRIRLFQLVDNK